MFEKIVLITKGQLVEVNGRIWEIKKLIERDGQTFAKLKSGCRRRTVPIERIDAYYGE